MTKRVVALGFFDGVHIGHAELLRRAKSIAEKAGAAAAVMTYSRHPSEVVGNSAVKLINTTEERIDIISEMFGITDIIVEDFTEEYSKLSCEDFVKNIIIEKLSACYVVAGYDFHFGSHGAGDSKMLVELCNAQGIGCDIINEVKLRGEKVSSTRIRKLIADGNVEEAAELLGHNHCIISNVSHGASIGSKIGFPTANQIIGNNIELPKFGVYLSGITVCDKTYAGITNIGVRPTVTDKREPVAETNIFGFDGDLYGLKIKLELLRFLREEKKFSSLEDLKNQITQDVAQAKEKANILF